MKQETKTIGQLIREKREACGLTQMKLSEQVGVSYQQVQKYEKSNDISVQRLIQIAKAVNVPITDFFPGLVERTAETQAGYHGKLLEDETLLLNLYRRIKSKKAKKAIIELLKIFTKP